MIPIHEWVRYVRQYKKIDTVRLGQRSNINPSLISRVENGKISPSLFFMVKLMYGLDLNLETFLNGIGIEAGFLADAWGTAQDAAAKETVVTVQDAERVSMHFSSQADPINEALAKALGGLFFTLGFTNHQVGAEQEAAAIVRQSIAGEPAGVVFPYPVGIKETDLMEAYVLGSLLTIQDLGMYVRLIRQKSGLPLRKYAQETGLSFNALSRLETGKIERILFQDLLAINDKSPQSCDVLSIAWKAGELYTGVLRSRALDSQQPPLPWEPETIRLIESLVGISRWYQVLLPTEFRWLKDLRQTLAA